VIIRLAAVACLTVAPLALSADRSPNIVMIVADDLGYGDLACYGSKAIRTPHLDALAKAGTRFADFCVAQPVCTASRAALLTGCYPNRLGMAGALNHTSTTGIHPSEELLPELLKAKGYATACFGKWHLGTRPKFSPLRHGFDEWFGLPYSNDNGPLHPTVKGIPPLPLYDGEKIVEIDPDQSRFTKRFTDRATAFIRANRDRPFFLYLPHVMPHVPIFASAAFRGKSKAGLYADVVEELDDSVGTVCDELRNCGLESNTVVIFLSDNGPFLSYGSHAGSAGPLREGKLTAFEGGVRVPMIVRWPRTVPANRTLDAFACSLDLLPTLCTVAGANWPMATVDGIDQSAVWFRGQPPASARTTFAYFNGSELHAVRFEKWKLHLPHEYLSVDGPPGRDGKPANHAAMKPAAIEESGIRGIATRHGYRVETIGLSLYDLATDPGERTDLAARNPEIVAKLSDIAGQFRRDLGDPLTKSVGTGLRTVGRDGGP
jgi:arylsulfatase